MVYRILRGGRGTHYGSLRRRRRVVCQPPQAWDCLMSQRVVVGEMCQSVNEKWKSSLSQPHCTSFTKAEIISSRIRNKEKLNNGEDAKNPNSSYKERKKISRHTVVASAVNEVLV